MTVMNPLGSLSSALPAATARLGSFERHAREYGPVVAGAIGVAQAGAHAAETVVDISAEGLERLGRMAEAAVDGVAEGVESGYDALAGALGEVVDGIGTVAQGAAGYAALGAAAGKRVFDELA